VLSGDLHILFSSKASIDELGDKFRTAPRVSVAFDGNPSVVDVKVRHRRSGVLSAAGRE
jgi:hypothetical protein